MHPTASTPEVEVYVFDSFTLDAKRRSLSVGASEVALGSRALDLLITLVQHAGDVLSREELVSRVWPRTLVEDSSLRVHIAALRKALNDSPAESRYIVNVPGRGYSFVGQIVRPSGPTRVAAPARAPLPRLVGRDAMLDTLERMVGRCGVVSLLGPGGVGKTSVARHASARMAPTFAGGTWWVDLSPAKDSGVLAQVAATLGLPCSTLSGLTSALRDTALLLVLDNCEHVLEDVAVLVEAIAGQAPRVRVLCTSREPLHVAGEHVLRLAPLGLAPVSAQTLPEALRAPALALFVERARATAGTVVFDDSDVPDLRELCRQLDGMPLALELAAWRVASMGLKGLLARPDDWLAILTRGRRGAEPRHQTLRAAIDWSCQLLDDTERRVLCRLAVFEAPFSLTSAAAVVQMPGEPASIEEVVLSLVDKSLLQPCQQTRDTDDGTGYCLLRTIRSHALEGLAALPEAEAVRARHALEMQRLASRQPSVVA